MKEKRRKETIKKGEEKSNRGIGEREEQKRKREKKEGKERQNRSS